MNRFIYRLEIMVIRMDKELLQKYIVGDATQEEKEVVASWIDADEANMKEYLALRKLYVFTLWNKDQIQASSAVSHSNKSPFPFFREALKIAAVFIFAFLMAYFCIYYSQTARQKSVLQTIYVPAGQHAEITLADGTHVWLNAKTKFSFPTNFEVSNRNVSLDGEAYFNVTHDSKRPFIVKAGKYSVQVYGTEFNVNAYSGKSIFETALLKGSVRVEEINKRTNSLMLQPGYKVAVENDRFVKSPITQYSYFKWKEGLICFDDNTIGEMLNKMELYFDVHFIIKNTHIINQRYTGKFRGNDGVEQVLKTLQLRSKFKYEFNDDRDVITIN